MTARLPRFTGRMIGVLVAGLALPLAMLAGCEENKTLHVDNSTGAPKEVAGPDRLIARANPDIVDVPIPVGFERDDSQSDRWVIPPNNVRFVNYVYKGSKGRDRVAAFYFEQMVTNGKWQQDGHWQTRGAWRLHFAKGHERCDIIITENMWGTTSVSVEIYPVGLQPPVGG